MKYPVIRYVFGRRGLKHGCGGVEIELYCAGKRRWVATGVSIEPHFWDDARMVVKHMAALDMNLRLRSLRDPMEDLLFERMTKGLPCPMEDLVALVKGPAKGRGFLDYWRGHIDSHMATWSPGTVRVHEFQLARLTSWGRISHFTDLTRDNIKKYIKLLEENDYKPASLRYYLAVFHSVVRAALVDGLIDSDPMVGFVKSVPEGAGRKYLTPEQVEKIRHCRGLTQSQQRYRDLFLFQCLTGLSRAELPGVDIGRIEQRGQKYVFTGERRKTGKPFYTVLLPEAYAILQRYGGRLPVVSGPSYFLGLRRIAQKAGLQRLTSHMGRHTAAVTFLNAGMPIEVVSKILGHSNIQTTQIYAKVVNKTVEDAFDRFMERMGQAQGKG